MDISVDWGWTQGEGRCESDPHTHARTHRHSSTHTHTPEDPIVENSSRNTSTHTRAHAHAHALTPVHTHTYTRHCLLQVFGSVLCKAEVEGTPDIVVTLTGKKPAMSLVTHVCATPADSSAAQASSHRLGYGGV